MSWAGNGNRHRWSTIGGLDQSGCIMTGETGLRKEWLPYPLLSCKPENFLFSFTTFVVRKLHLNAYYYIVLGNDQRCKKAVRSRESP